MTQILLKHGKALTLLLSAISLNGCIPSSTQSTNLLSNTWVIDSQEQWLDQINPDPNLIIEEGFVSTDQKTLIIQSQLHVSSTLKQADSITLSQSPIWQNWSSVKQMGPINIVDAPVFLRRAPYDYWVFARYGDIADNEHSFQAKPASLAGFDLPLYTTPSGNQYDAPGAQEPHLGGYHAWQSKDMINWVHHGAVSDRESRWMTSAEQVGDQTYFYYDFPNDQDPHLIIDEDLTDGKMGVKMGMAFKDPSDGSDSAIIRDLDGNFHLILENWSPISANKRAWDSPLANHAVSKDGINDFKLVEPAVDYRTQPTGKFDQYPHPHWHKEDPENYAPKPGDPNNRAYATYEIHSPEQDAFGDWAAISIGGQYYLFGDYDPAGSHGQENMKIAWLTSSSINEPFEFVGTIGQGHPDPDIMFAKGQFHLISQVDDFVSPGPWVDGVDVRVGVDTNGDHTIDQWTAWTRVKEEYDYIEGFAKQVSKTPANLNLSNLPQGYGFKFEVRLTDTTDNASTPILDRVEFNFSH